MARAREDIWSALIRAIAQLTAFCMASNSVYKKHFVPLESNPELFTELAHSLGLSSTLAFHDVFSIDDPELLALIPRPALALVLVFPTTATYEEHTKHEEKLVQDYAKSGSQEDVIWFKQTINNACGLYGMLHAMSNGEARNFVGKKSGFYRVLCAFMVRLRATRRLPYSRSQASCHQLTLHAIAAPDSHLSRLLDKCQPLDPLGRAEVLENDTELKSAYRTVATRGSSQVPDSPEDEVDFHYVCFVKSGKNGHLYELDGDRKGPKDRGLMEPDDDVLSEAGRIAIKEFIQRERGQNPNFSLLVLATA